MRSLGFRAVRDALLEHKQLGQPIVIADENENVVWVPAEEIQIPDLPDSSAMNSASDTTVRP